MMHFKADDEVRVVEHDDSTREPRKGGRVTPATVIQVGGIYVQVRYGNGSKDTFYQESGWRAWDGEFRWRLAPVADQEPAPAAAGEEER